MCCSTDGASLEQPSTKSGHPSGPVVVCDCDPFAGGPGQSFPVSVVHPPHSDRKNPALLNPRRGGGRGYRNCHGSLWKDIVSIYVSAHFRRKLLLRPLSVQHE